MRAPTKHVVEAPVLRGVSPAGGVLDADTRESHPLHPRLHPELARAPDTTADQLVDWINRELFLMPPDDPTLGLDVAEPFVAAQSMS